MTIGAEKSKKTTVPERPRREISTTALKVVAKTGGLSYPHKGKRGNEAEVLKTKDRRWEAVHSTHGQRREAWKTAESCGVTESGSSSTDTPTVIVRFFGLLLGQAHSVVMVRPSGHL